MNTGLIIGLVIAIVLILMNPPCCPGAARSCDGGVSYCRKSGFGWEGCQKFNGPVYPQAKWRAEELTQAIRTASQDPSYLRTMADVFESQGLVEQAKLIRQRAERLEQ